MRLVVSSGTVDLLAQFHARLHDHYSSLHAARSLLDSAAPVFALEHGLSEVDLDLLQVTVRASVAQGFSMKHRTWWLPFVVYAAESGYGYNG
jgi:hypothetical protein